MNVKLETDVIYNKSKDSYFNIQTLYVYNGMLSNTEPGSASCHTRLDLLVTLQSFLM